MTNGTWVCFDCRTAVRRRTWRLSTLVRPWLVGSTAVGGVRCPGCRQACHFLGPAIEIPPRRETRRWARLREQIARVHAATVDQRFREYVRRGHELEQRIRDLESRPPSPGRDELIRVLQGKLAAGDFVQSQFPVSPVNPY